jgi:hypothetical protein
MTTDQRLARIAHRHCVPTAFGRKGRVGRATNWGPLAGIGGWRGGD